MLTGCSQSASLFRYQLRDSLITLTALPWRDSLNRIHNPIVSISGERSVQPPASHRWVHSQITASLLEIFYTSAGAHHIACVRNF